MFLSEGIAATSFFYDKVRMIPSSATSSAFGPVAPTGKNPFPSLFQGECGPCSLAGGAHLGLCFHYHTPCLILSSLSPSVQAGSVSVGMTSSGASLK